MDRRTLSNDQETDEHGRGSGTLGRCGAYELLVELAAGGMATVFLARPAEGREGPLVAIKRPHRHLASDKAYLSMLVDEARLASAIQHDNVVKVRELGFASGEPFIVMDYVEGASLADVRKELSAQGRAIDPRFATRITLDALAGLQAAHVLHDDNGRHLGIVHRDVSPHNVLIGCDGSTRLTDFGIAKAQDRVQVTRTHEVKGKLAYLAPERIDKRRICTVQSDVFSMAVVLWESIAGRRLFRGDEAIDTLQEVMHGTIPSLRKIGVPIAQALDDAILRGLSRDLDTRYKSAAEFADALERAAGKMQVAKPAEIAMLIEAIFGDRLRVRHEEIRLSLPGEAAEHVLEVSGLNPRPAPTPEMREREKIAIQNIAPPAPSARYAFGNGSENLFQRKFATKKARMIALGTVAALAAMGLGLLVFHHKPAPNAGSGEPIVRKVIVPLPFEATHVTFDDQSHDMPAPTDIASFDVPRESGTRHRVTAVAATGARAEAYVVEQNGVATPEGDGFAVESLDSYDDDPNGPSAANSAGGSGTTVIELPSTTPTGKRGRKWRTVPPRHTVVAPPPPASPAPPPATASPAPPPASRPVVTVTKDGFTKLK